MHNLHNFIQGQSDMNTGFDKKICGENVKISSSEDWVTRTKGFNNSIVLSNKSIKPEQLFSVKIEETSELYEGNLRIGFTILPNDNIQPIPLYSVPDLVEKGGTWLWAINALDSEKTIQRPPMVNISASTRPETKFEQTHRRGASVKETWIESVQGNVPLYKLISDEFMINHADSKDDSVALCEKGSVVSIIYHVEVINTDETHSCHTLVNMTGQSPNSSNQKHISYLYTFLLIIDGCIMSVYNDTICVYLASERPELHLPPIRAIVDVYGSTKSVTIFPVEQVNVQSLHDLSLQKCAKFYGQIETTKLPKALSKQIDLISRKMSFINMYN